VAQLNREGIARAARGLSFLLAFTLLFVADANARVLRKGVPKPAAVKASKSWYFAVSGDSRDCGDLIMPKIAQSIRDNRAKTPVDFYWHLGDLRALFRIDCDMLMRRDPNATCPYDATKNYSYTPTAYFKDAWDDFIENQIAPFDWTPFIVGIGNHELGPYTIKGVERKFTPDDFKSKFKFWLTQAPLITQLKADMNRGIPSQPAGNTFFHFIHEAVDFIYLDNVSDNYFFNNDQLKWFEAVLKADEAKDSKVKTIIVGMHAALPDSCARNHAMDRTSCGRCSGSRVYQWLKEARDEHGKNVYVFASHSHYFAEHIYTYGEGEHKEGKALPGWLIGTAGAQQYKMVEDSKANRQNVENGTLCVERIKTEKVTNQIQYGYLLVEVTPTGEIKPKPVWVTPDNPLTPDVKIEPELSKYCFNSNIEEQRADTIQPGECNCYPQK
jgi:hypothetical protein